MLSKNSIAQLRSCGYPMAYIVYKKLYHLTPKPLRKIVFSWWERWIVEKISDQNFHIDRDVIPKILANKRKVYIFEGYFFAYQYVREAGIREDFTLTSSLTQANMSIHKQIAKNPDSVFLHIRRGDYLIAKNAHFIRLDNAYYEQALRIMREHIPNAHIFVFSNDMAWCKEHFLDSLSAEVKEGLRFSFIEGNDEGNATEDMELMSACKHAIIANSTFSWWAAYRISNPAKIIIAPDRFTIYWTQEQTRSCYPPEWILLDSSSGERVQAFV